MIGEMKLMLEKIPMSPQLNFIWKMYVLFKVFLHCKLQILGTINYFHNNDINLFLLLSINQSRGLVATAAYTLISTTTILNTATNTCDHTPMYNLVTL